MGEVYRATDSNLKRSVAIKVLPPAVAGDADRLARFQREAEVLAALNHPNIAAIYGLERTSDFTALVMELVEGQGLDEMIGAGSGAQRAGLPVEEALAIAKQIAEALEAAHEQGIIHRDLKPANIKIRADGTVKVLDFGLAKALDAAPTSPAPQPLAPSASISPTITSPALMTGLGMILGTAAYMAPEQARGKTVDRRADIWAFGAVLFEMLSGRRAFEAEDVSLTLAEVMKSEPDWKLLPPIPPALGMILRQCLKKDPKQRIQSIGDVRLALDGAFDIAAPVAATTFSRPKEPMWKRAIPVVAAAAIAGGAAWFIHRPAAQQPSPQRVSITLPADQSIAFGCSPCSSIAISPDGTQIAYVNTTADVVLGGNLNGSLHVRSLSSRADRELPGTAGAYQPFFSPDGQWLAYFTSNGDLKKVALAGGNPITVLTNIHAGHFAFGAWSDSQTIVFDDGGGGSAAAASVDGLRRVSVEGGTASSITQRDAAHGELRHGVPEIVPGTETVLFTVTFGGTRPPRIEAVNLDGSGRRIVLENASAAHVVTGGHLLFQRDDVLLVAPFNTATLTVTGPAVPLVDDVRRDGPAADAVTPQLGVSRTGTLAYVPGVDPMKVLGSVSRSGVFEPLGLAPDRFLRVAVAPDGHSVAFDVVTGAAATAVRLYDLTRGSTTRIAQGGGSDQAPAWHPDGRAVAVQSRKADGTRGIFLKEPGGVERLLVADTGTPGPINGGGLSLSSDGATLAYAMRDPVRAGAAANIWITATGGAPNAHRLFNRPASDISPAFSPDGRWLAYVSDEPGRNEVFIERYPQGDRVQVSTTGGGGPVWRGDGKEIYFQTAIGGVPKVMAASVSVAGDRLAVGKPVPLFDMRVTEPSGVREQFSSSSIVGRRWDVFPDGQHFLVIRGADPQGAREIVLVQHWDEELRRLAPTK